MKKLTALLAALTIALGLTACGQDAPDEVETSEPVTLTVAASPAPHSEILKQAADLLAQQNITLEILEYGDYTRLNPAVAQEEADANFFQHAPYLAQYNADSDAPLVSVAAIHFEPMGVYPGQADSLADLSDGAVIAVPNDTTNRARALLLLEEQGVLTLRESSGLRATPNDILDNPKHLIFQEMDAAMLPHTIAEVDLSVINANYALEGGLDPVADALVMESADSPAARTYANLLVVKEGREEDPAILALAEALQSDDIRDYIQDTYTGTVVPVF